MVEVPHQEEPIQTRQVSPCLRPDPLKCRLRFDLSEKNETTVKQHVMLLSWGAVIVPGMVPEAPAMTGAEAEAELEAQDDFLM